jgi:hypothetical protein
MSFESALLCDQEVAGASHIPNRNKETARRQFHTNMNLSSSTRMGSTKVGGMVRDEKAQINIG